MKRGHDTRVRARDRYLDAALRYLARCDRTASQIQTYLLRKGATAEQARAVLAKLAALRYVDDEAYAVRWAESRLDRTPMGKERLRAELSARGLPEPVVERTVAASFRDRGEEALARLALQRRGGTIVRSPRHAVRFLRQRGFDEETIESVVGIRDQEGA